MWKTTGRLLADARFLLALLESRGAQRRCWYRPLKAGGLATAWTRPERFRLLMVIRFRRKGCRHLVPQSQGFSMIYESLLSFFTWKRCSEGKVLLGLGWEMDHGPLRSVRGDFLPLFPLPTSLSC